MAYHLQWLVETLGGFFSPENEKDGKRGLKPRAFLIFFRKIRKVHTVSARVTHRSRQRAQYILGRSSFTKKMRVGVVCLLLLGALAWQARGQDEEENTETYASALLEVRYSNVHTL